MQATTQQSIHQRFDALAASDPNEFRQFFRRLQKAFPEQAAEAGLLYIAAHGLDTAARTMTYWLVVDATYVKVLLDVDSLPTDTAAKAITAVKELDPQFLVKFAKAISALTSPPAILRSLVLLPALGDYSILIPLLRTLSEHGDVRIRSCAARLLCELRPNKALIERQMQSGDARVRAGAVDALLLVKTEDNRSMLRAATTDLHHRVVANALVSLYQLGETEELNRMIELCSHKQHLFRAAMAWALGEVKDPRGIPALHDLTRDPSLVVRKRALNSLLILESVKSAPDESDSGAGATKAASRPSEKTAEAEALDQFSPSFSLLH